MNALAPRQVPDRCARKQTPRSPCRACLEACPRGLLSLAEEAPRPVSGCDGCNACVAACRLGALLPRTGDDALPPDPVPGQGEWVVACHVASASEYNDQVPCLAAIPESAACLAALRGVRRIVFQSGDCRRCPRDGGSGVVDRALARTLSFLRGGPLEPLVERRFLPGQEPSARATLTRRGLLSFWRQRIPAGTDGATHRTPWIRTVEAVRSVAGGVPDHRARERFLDIRIAPSCTGCRVCSEVCPTGAIERSDSAEGVVIRFAFWKCTGCGNCEACCLPGALSLTQGPPDHEWARWVQQAAEISPPGPFPRARVPRLPCPVCATPLLGPEPCVACRSASGGL